MGINNISAQRKQVYEAILNFLDKELESLRALPVKQGIGRNFYRNLAEARAAIKNMIFHIDSLEGLSEEKVRLG